MWGWSIEFSKARPCQLSARNMPSNLKCLQQVQWGHLEKIIIMVGRDLVTGWTSASHTFDEIMYLFSFSHFVYRPPSESENHITSIYWKTVISNSVYKLAFHCFMFSGSVSVFSESAFSSDIRFSSLITILDDTFAFRSKLSTFFLRGP